jgi:hypothetical protein
MTAEKTELRDSVTSRARLDLRWIKSSPGRLISYLFEMNTEFLDAHLIPSGDFFVLYYVADARSRNPLPHAKYLT